MALPCRPRPSPEAIQTQIDRVLPAYEVHLRNQGHSASGFSSLTRTARHLVAWRTINQADIATLDIRDVDGFLRHDCNCPAEFCSQMNKCARWQAHQVLAYLLESGQAAVPSAIVTGGEFVESFTGTLAAQGYRESTVRAYRSQSRHFIVWLYLSGLTLAAIDGDALQQFLRHDCTCSHPRFLGRSGQFGGKPEYGATIARFASFLIERNVVADWRDPAPQAQRNCHVDAFLGWLRQHRGVREATLQNYERSLRAVLPLLGGSPDAYDVAVIRTAILDRAQSRSRGQLANERTALRSYLRFLEASGLCRPGLAGTVPSTGGTPPAAELPRYVEPKEIEALIASCDATTAIGCRDRAVLLLLARLALRPGDVTALRLADIDWEQALLTVSGKSRRREALPLPQDAGDALKDYLLRVRPRVADTTVFLRSVAPHADLSSSAVGSIVRRAMQRTGIDREGLPAAYLFRHSRATHLLRGGASVETVGALLRHRSVKTTARYARVDVPMLLAVAQPWPEEPA